MFTIGAYMNSKVVLSIEKNIRILNSQRDVCHS